MLTVSCISMKFFILDLFMLVVELLLLLLLLLLCCCCKEVQELQLELDPLKSRLSSYQDLPPVSSVWVGGWRLCLQLKFPTGNDVGIFFCVFVHTCMCSNLPDLAIQSSYHARNRKLSHCACTAMHVCVCVWS